MSSKHLNSESSRARLIVSTSAPGKVILFGEHAVVFKRPALASSLSLRTQCELSSTDNDKSEIFLLAQSYSINTQSLLQQFVTPPQIQKYQEKCSSNTHSHLDTELLDQVWSFCKNNYIYSSSISSKTLNPTAQSQIETALKCVLYTFISGAITWASEQISNLQQPIPQSVTSALSRMNFTCQIESAVPLGSGLGSSASFSVAMVSAFMYWFSHEFDLKSAHYDTSNLEMVNAQAFQMETIIHGNPSGIDNSVATFGGLILLNGDHLDPNKYKRFEHIDWSEEPLRILLVNTNVPRDTKSLVAGVRQRYDDPQQHDHIEKVLDSLTNCSLDFLNMTTKGNFNQDKLKKIIDQSHTELNKLGVGHEQLDRIVQIAHQRGLHGKLTGAGGGGCAFVFIPSNVDEHVVKHLTEEYEKLGFWCQSVHIGGNGVEILSRRAYSELLPQTPDGDKEARTNFSSRSSKKNTIEWLSNFLLSWKGLWVVAGAALGSGVVASLWCRQRHRRSRS